MRKFVGLFAISVAMMGLTYSAAVAKPLEGSLHGQSSVSQSQCPNGPLVLNVTEKISGDADSGTASTVWAFDDYVRHIQVVEVGAGSYCATLSYQGNFTTEAGPSPQAATTGGTVGEGVVGNFDGGYVATFTGTQNANPSVNGVALKTKGSIGKFDYACDDTGACPGYFDWVAVFFGPDADASFTYSSWGWTYHTSSNGTWINASSGNLGDITGN
jgi:hypothetical protein